MLTTGDVYELAIKQSYGGSTLLNVYHFRLLRTLTGPQAAFQSLADTTKNRFRTDQAAALSYVDWKATQVAGAGVTYDPTTCRRSGGDVYEGTFTGTLTGGNTAGAPDASFMALVCALKTGFAGRSRRGSFYLGGWDANDQSSANRNLWSAARITSIQSACNAHLASFGAPSGTDLDFRWVVFSRLIASGCKYVIVNNRPTLTHVQAANAADSWRDVTSCTPREAIVPMNRRKLGAGV